MSSSTVLSTGTESMLQGVGRRGGNRQGGTGGRQGANKNFLSSFSSLADMNRVMQQATSAFGGKLHERYLCKFSIGIFKLSVPERSESPHAL